MIPRRWLATLSLLCLGPGAWAGPSDPNQGLRLALQAELEDFSTPGWDRRPQGAFEPPTAVFVPAAGPAVTTYRERLIKNGAWTGGPVWHQAGTLPLVRPGQPTERLGVNVFFPAGPSKGTLLFVHGYLSHSANFAYTLAWFTARGWTVATLDLPGHGLSTGPRGDVDSFAEYGDAVAVWLGWARAQGWPGPTTLLAHSLGSAACLEALRRPGALRPDRIVFCAPLLRPNWYPALAFGEAVAGWALTDLPSTFGWDGYLDGYTMPVHWFRMLSRWLDGLATQGPIALPLTIYCGDRDSVVDAGWNRGEYGRLVPQARWQVLPGQDHLFLSATEVREAFHRQLSVDLGL